MSNDYSPDMWAVWDALNFMNGDTDFLKKDEMTDVLGEVRPTTTLDFDCGDAGVSDTAAT